MKPRDIVEAAFRFEETDVVPYHIPFDEEVGRRLDEHYGTESWRQKLVPFMCARHIGNPIQDLGDGTGLDGFGTVIKMGNILHVVHPALPGPSLDGYEWPAPEDLANFEVLGGEMNQMTESFRLFGMAMGLFERAWIMRGMQDFLMDLIANPDFVDELLDGILEVHLRFMDTVAERLPVDAYFGGDDWCDQRGPIMGPRLWRRFFKPRLAKLIDNCHSHNLRYVCHSCGNLLPLIDDLLEIGVDALESLQPEAMDVYELKRRTYGRMVLIGGMGVQSTLPFGTPGDVRETTQKLICEMGQGGGYVLGPAKPLLPDVPTANAAAFCETVVNQCETLLAPVGTTSAARGGPVSY